MQTWTNSSRSRAVALAGPVTGDPMANAIEFAELFDVDVDKFAGCSRSYRRTGSAGSSAESL